MSRQYTTADFANARFAEDEYGHLAMRSLKDGEVAWYEQCGNRHTDEEMTHIGFVPFPAKRTITEIECRDLYRAAQYGASAFVGALGDQAITVVPNPELTNVEKLQELIKDEWWAGHGSLAEYLDDAGVKAPED